MYQKIEGGDFLEEINKEIPADDSTSLGEKMLLYWMIRELKPEVVIETGTHRGLTSLYMAQAIHDNQFGYLHTADPFDWGQTGNFRKFPELEKVMKFYLEEGSEMINKLEKIDFAFIDGFHEIQDVIPEVKNILPKLSSNAIVVFHDCWYGNTDGVNEALDECGLKSVWLPTKNAIRIYRHEVGNPRDRYELYNKN